MTPTPSVGIRPTFLVGVGGIGSGMFLALRGNRTLGRNESRAAALLDRRDFCKLHIVAHYVAVLGRAGDGRMAVLPIGKVGRDSAGGELLDRMRQAGMDTRFVTPVEARTLFSVCLVYPDGEGGNVTTDDSASAGLTAADVDEALAGLPDALSAAGLDAGARGVALAVPEVPLATRAHLLGQARRRGWMTAAAMTTAEVVAAGGQGLLADVDLLSLNHEEAAALAGLPDESDSEEIAAAAGERFGSANPSGMLCVTAGARGAYGWQGGRVEHTPAPEVAVVNTAGAGDATLAGLLVGLIGGLPFIRPGRPRRGRLSDLPLETAMDLAALLAGRAVQSEDTIDFAADADALAALAGRIGADADAVLAALPGGAGGAA